LEVNELNNWRTIWEKKGNPQGELRIHIETGKGEFFIRRKHASRTAIESIEIEKESLIILAQGILAIVK